MFKAYQPKKDLQVEADILAYNEPLDFAREVNL